MAVFVVAAAATTVVSGVSSFASGQTAGKNTRDAAAYNSQATLANGKISAAITRFDALAPAYQARMDADTARLNSIIYGLNAETAQVQGTLKAKEARLAADYVLADSAISAESSEREAFEEFRDRFTVNEQIDSEVSGIVSDYNRKKAVTTATLASMGVALTPEMMESIQRDLSSDTEQAFNQLAYTRVIQNRASGRRSLAARTKATDARRLGAQEAFALRASADMIDVETANAVTMFKNEAAKYAETGEYMDWYSGFITESTELKAKALEAGAQIQSDQTFMVGMANASQQRSQGTSQLISSFGQGASILASRPPQG